MFIPYPVCSLGLFSLKVSSIKVLLMSALITVKHEPLLSRYNVYNIGYQHYA